MKNITFENAKNYLDGELTITCQGNEDMIAICFNNIDDGDIAMLVCITNDEFCDRAITRFIRNIRNRGINIEYANALRAAYTNAAEMCLRCATEEEA